MHFFCFPCYEQILILLERHQLMTYIPGDLLTASVGHKTLLPNAKLLGTCGKVTLSGYSLFLVCLPPLSAWLEVKQPFSGRGQPCFLFSNGSKCKREMEFSSPQRQTKQPNHQTKKPRHQFPSEQQGGCVDFTHLVSLSLLEQSRVDGFSYCYPGSRVTQNIGEWLLPVESQMARAPQNECL